MDRKKKRDQKANLEKDLLLDPESMARRKKKKRRKTVSIILIGAVLIVCIVFISFQAVRAIGRSNLKSMAADHVPELTQTADETDLTEQEKENWQEGWVRYKNQIYAYNQDIMTFLFMGIDKRDDVAEEEEGTNGGQADALFLLVVNPHDKTIRVIGINRNTMTDIDLYNEDGAYMTTTTAQIAVQHGFGNGLEESCEYQVEAVRKLFYNLPVHGYCAINMEAIISLTDLMGGIELTALEDVRSKLPGEDRNTNIVTKGETALLDGRKAYSYVSYRDVNTAGSADSRLQRQQQFLGEFIKKVKTSAAADISLPVRMYNSITKQMVTNVTADEVAYLASTVTGYHFDKSQFYTLQGENVQGEQFEEFYVDEDALYKMILDIFYEPVENQ